jgi:hypothetical protein
MTKRRAVLALAIIVGVLVAGSQVEANAQLGTFRVTPTAGPQGTTITLTSVTPCPMNPAGVTGSRLVRATLFRGPAVIARGTFPVSASGAWSGTITVGPQAALGRDMLDAFCFSSPQAEGVTLAYGQIPFIVTGGPSLAQTGFSPGPWRLIGGLLLVVGAALLRAGHPRERGRHALGR